MATYTEPRENLAIFDSSVFRDTNEGEAGGGLTPAQADRRYLRFPIAQGTETIASLNTGGVLAITQNGTTGVKILNTQTGSAAQPPTSGRTDFFNEDTTGAEVNSAMIDYSGIHTGTLNTINHVSGTMNICPNIARAAPVNIATGANNTAGCIVNIANGTGTNSSIIRIGKQNLFDLDNGAASGNGSMNLCNQSGSELRLSAGSSVNNNILIGNGQDSAGLLSIGSGLRGARAITLGNGQDTPSGATITIGSGTNSQGAISIGDGASSTGVGRSISIGSGALSGTAFTKNISIGAPLTLTGSSAVVTAIGRVMTGLAGGLGGVTVSSSSSTAGKQIDIIGSIRLNATGAVGNTLTVAGQANASGAIDIANGSNGLATVSICSGSTNNGVLNLGNCGSGSTGTINIGANGGTGLIQMGSAGRAIDFRGATISMFPTTFQVTGTNFSVGSGTTTLFNGGGITLGNSAQAASLLTIAQNTAGLVAGNLGFRTAASVAAANFTTASSNNYQNFATITAPAYQVSLINITALWDSKEAVASIRLGVAVSLTSGNNSTEAAAGLSFFQELDTQATAVIQSKQPLTGVYINTTASPVSLFVNAQFNQAWVTTAPQFSVTTSITKIG
jgi:hypothetical protein